MKSDFLRKKEKKFDENLSHPLTGSKKEGKIEISDAAFVRTKQSDFGG
jgi:hypothetical protein